MKKIKFLPIVAIILILMILAVGCSPQATEATEEVAKVTESPEPKPTEVPDNMSANTQGNFYFEIPDSWEDKVTIKVDGTKTVLRHNTLDESQPEINPVLVEIYSTYGSEPLQGESFVIIGDYVFSRSLRFDMPYTAGSEDAAEFEAIFSELPQVLHTLDLLDRTDSAPITIIEEGLNCELPDDEPHVAESGKPFTKEDIYVSDFRLGDAKEDVLSKVGAPQSTLEEVWEATGEVRDINEFSFGKLVFVDEKLVEIEISDATYEGPRGIKVDMHMDEVSPLFAYDIELNNPYMTIFYRANYGDEEDFAVPPSAVLYKGDMQTLFYSVFADDSVTTDISLEELADGEYLFYEQYTLSCDFDSRGLLLSFTLSVGALAE